jgi:glutaminyl-peptide cyclotransferase
VQSTVQKASLLALLVGLAACAGLPACGSSTDPGPQPAGDPADSAGSNAPTSGVQAAAGSSGSASNGAASNGAASNGAASNGPGPDGSAGAGAPADPVARPKAPIKIWRHRVVASYPHDPEAFTQGLVFDGGRLFESTGQRGRSTLREVDLLEGTVLRNLPLENPLHFAEGLEVVGDRLYQLTWQARVGFIYDKRTFELLGTFTYEGEGWGLTFDGTHLVLSDGTPTLRFLDPESFEVVRRVTVTGNGREVRNLNELEYVDGEIWANVWKVDEILRIDPATGDVLGVIDMRGLNTYARALDFDGSHRNVLNGIAYDQMSGRLFVTGKEWPELHEIEVFEP